MFKQIALTVLAVAFISACGGSERQNPIASQNIGELARWINIKVDLQNSKRPQLIACAKFWGTSTGTEFAHDSAPECNDISAWLASEMTAANFGKITAEDIPYPPLWLTYIGIIKNTYDPSVLEGSIR